MGLRAFITIAGVTLVGVLTVACSQPSESPPNQSPPNQSQPAPSAPGVSWLRVSPGQGTPGSAVSLDVACLDNLGAVHSPVLHIGALRGNPNGHQPWHLFGSGSVHRDAAPGRYQISATCGTAELSAPFTVLPAPGG